MQMIKFSTLEDYLEKVDAYDSPKTIKIVECYRKETDCRLRAITFPLTFQMEWQWFLKGEEAQWAFDIHLETLKAHGHRVGKITESARVGV